MKRGLFLCVLLAGCVRGGFEARALDRGATDRPAERAADRPADRTVDWPAERGRDRSLERRDLAAELGPGDGSSRELAADRGGDRARDTSQGETSVSFTFAVTPPSWTTTLRGRQAFHAFAVLPDGGSLEITEQVS